MSALPAILLNGLRADSLGMYLASLGVFSLVARKWPEVRACWRNACLCLVGGPATLEQVVEFVSEIGQENSWSEYDKPWDNAKKADVEESLKGKDRKTSRRTALWRALEAEERLLPAFGAHLALDDRVRMNPLLGTGGNAGQRKFDRGWRNAVDCIEKPPRRQSRDSLNADLKAFLDGQACAYLGGFSAGSWFGAANKIYNHGTKRPFREGEITPWAMALACEGLPYFAGSPSRQLGSSQQPKGAFPFVTTAMAPKGKDEAGGVEAEVWVPIWNQPMTEPELRALFLRGRTELGGKGTTSSAEFAAGVMSRGIDAGIVEFRRFLLLHTTSANTFESRLASVVPVPRTSPDDATTRAIRTIVELRDTLPSDHKIGRRWQFSGVRGPLEEALVDFAATRPGEGRTEQAWALVDQMIESLVKVDRNRTFRSQNVRFRLLPGEWATSLFQGDPPDREVRLALAVSSLAGTPTSPKFIAYHTGVQQGAHGKYWAFPESVPTRRIWSEAELTENLSAVTERRVMEAMRKAESRSPFGAAIRINLDDMHAWLSGNVDEERMRVWLDRLCVFDWADGANGEAARRLQHGFTSARPVIDGALVLYVLFRPLASDWLFRQILRESNIQARATPTCACLGRVIAMLRRGDVSAAVDVALATYRSAGVALADFNALSGGPDPLRLLAALVIPVRDKQILTIFQRWRSPTESYKK